MDPTAIENWFRSKGYTIHTIIDGPTMKVGIFAGVIPVGSIEITKGGDYKENVRSGNRTVEAFAHRINNLEIAENYRSQGLATRLMIYAMLKTMLSAPLVKWWVLDDDSDNASNPARNIYSRLGFEPVDQSGNGPERQLLITNFRRLLSRRALYSGKRTKSPRKSTRKSRNRSRK